MNINIISAKYIHQLQLLQNRAARLIQKLKPWDHITPSLKDLHWLKVTERISFKILVNVFKCVNGVHVTRLSSEIVLQENLSCSTMGTKSFSYLAANHTKHILQRETSYK